MLTWSPRKSEAESLGNKLYFEKLCGPQHPLWFVGGHLTPEIMRFLCVFKGESDGMLLHSERHYQALTPVLQATIDPCSMLLKMSLRPTPFCAKLAGSAKAGGSGTSTAQNLSAFLSRARRSRGGLMESRLHHHCCGGPPPPTG